MSPNSRRVLFSCLTLLACFIFGLAVLGGIALLIL